MFLLVVDARRHFFLTKKFQLENEQNVRWHYDANNETDQLVSLNKVNRLIRSLTKS